MRSTHAIMPVLALAFVLSSRSLALTLTCPGCDAMCGPKCLALVAARMGVDLPIGELLQSSEYGSRHGTTLLGLKEAAEAKGLRAVGMKIGVEELAASGVLAIAHQWGNHFVVVEGGDPGTVKVTDPPAEPQVVPFDEFKRSYSGFALLIAKDESAFPTPEAKGPDLRFDSYIFDFGFVEEGQQAQHTFTYENKGNQELVLTKAETSCGCTRAALTEERRVPPGGKGELAVGFDATGREGGQSEAVYVYSNDPISPTVQLTIGGVVKPTRLLLSARSLYYGEVRKRDSTKKEFAVRDPGDGSLHVDDVASNSPFVKVSVVGKPEKPGDAYTISAELQPGAPLGELKAKITLSTDHPREPVVEIPIAAKIIGDLRTFPDQFFLGMLKKGRTVSKTITLSTSADEPLAIRQLKSPFKYLKLTSKPDIEGKRYTVTAALKDNAPVGLIEGEVIIRTNNKDQPEIRLPVYALVEE